MRAKVAAALMALGLGAQAPPAKGPVLVELFTSEGCSSCPPADGLLTRLAADGRVVALAFHVDYWDGLGWRDPYASPDFTRRQQTRATRTAGGRIYTPEMAVDGGKGFVGSDEAQARHALDAAAGSPKAAVHLRSVDGRLGVEVAPLPEAGRAWLALAEDGLETKVARGENAGRTLRHDGVVREFRSLGEVRAGEAFRNDAALTLREGWRRGRLKAVVFVESAATGRVLAVAAARL